jgi:hypothetical protein
METAFCRELLGVELIVDGARRYIPAALLMGQVGVRFATFPVLVVELNGM